MKRVKAQRYMYQRGNRFWFRRGVPHSLRSQFGGRSEVQVSLRTSDLTVARHALTAELLKFELLVSSGRAGDVSTGVSASAEGVEPTTQDIDKAIRAWFRDRHERSRRELFKTAVKLEEALGEVARHSDDVKSGLQMGARSPAWTTRWAAEALIAAQKWEVEPGSDLERHILQGVGRGQRELDELRRQDIHGEPRHHLDATFAPDAHKGDEEIRAMVSPGKRVTLQMLLDRYMREAKLAPATEKAWRRLVSAFEQFLPHRDAQAVTSADVVRWKDHLGGAGQQARQPLSAKTINDTYLASLRVVYSFGVENGIVDHNPAIGVRMRGRKEPRCSSSDYLRQLAA